MGWNMYKDGKARYDMRVKQQLTVRDMAILIAPKTTVNGKRKVLTDEWNDEDGYVTKEKEWTKKEIDEVVRRKLQQFGYDEIRAIEEDDLEIDIYGNIDSEELLETCKKVIVDKYNIDDLREKYGYEPLFLDRMGGSRHKSVDVSTYMRKTKSGKPTKVKYHKRRIPK